MTDNKIPAYEALCAERPANADTIALFCRNMSVSNVYIRPQGRLAEGFTGGRFIARRFFEEIQLSDP